LTGTGQWATSLYNGEDVANTQFPVDQRTAAGTHLEGGSWGKVAPKMTGSVCRLLLALQLLVPLPALALDHETPDHTRTLWTERDGLPANEILDIAQDHDGFLWLATTTGLVRFDGNRFVLWRLGENPLIGIRTLYVARDGSLWLALYNSSRISRLHRGQLTTYEGLPGPVLALTQTRDGVVWAGGLGGLSAWRHQRWERVAHPLGSPELTVDALFEDSGGNLLVGAAQGIYRRAAGSDAFYLVMPNSSAAHSFVELANREVLANGSERVAVSLTGHGATSAAVAALGKVQGRRLLLDRQQALWAATSKGLIKINDYPNGRVQRVSTELGIRCLFEDRDGNIWLGTVDGLVRLSKTRIISLGTTKGAAHFVWALAVAKDGTVWGGTAHGLVRFSPIDQRIYEGSHGAPTGLVTGLAAAPDGALWIGSGEGLTRYVNGRSERASLPGFRSPNSVTSITIDADGAVWASDKYGVFRWKEGQVSRFGSEHGPAASAYADTHGRVWFGFWDGTILAYDQRGFRQYSQHVGPAAAPIIGIAEDSRGRVWVASTAGISRFDDGRFTTLLHQRRLPGSQVISFTIDRDDHLWLGVTFGIARLTPHEFDKAVADPSYGIQYSLYGASAGLVGSPRYFGYPNVIRHHDGTLWFAATKGLFLFDPNRLQEHRTAPPVIIDSVLADGRPVTLEAPARLSAGTSKVEIDYTAAGVGVATKLRYRRMLEGFDARWVDDDTNQRAVYTNLFPGEYRLRIAASYGDGAWTEPSTVWAFSVAPHFYQTAWFYTSCALALSLGFWMTWRLRSRRVHEQFSLVLAERARMGREIHDTLLQSLVGTALQLDNISTELGASHDSVKQQLHRMRRQVERYVADASESIRSLRSPRLERLDLAAALQEAGREILHSTAIDFQFTADTVLPPCSPAMEQQLLRIAQEAVTNAARHARPSTITMDLRRDRNSLRLRVADDGRGLHPEAIEPNRAAHWGMAIMEERAQQIGGSLTVATTPGGGTTIEVVAPLSPKNRWR
jgi:ligand-binding sensor domain-containing protein/two-component sensor histidine kinase